MTDLEAYPILVLILAWISREVIPLYMKKKPQGVDSYRSKAGLATKEDILNIERRLTVFGDDLKEVRDWMLISKGREEAKKNGSARK